MIKPQEKHDDVFIKREYPERVIYYYEAIKEHLPELQHEDLEALAEEVYKEAYTDGFKDALFFCNRME